MSEFAHRLRDGIEADYGGSQARFAESAGISQAAVSRLVREEVSPSPETIQALANSLPAALGASLCASWLRDVIPSNLRNLITVRTAKDPDFVSLSHLQPDEWARLDAKSRDALSYLAQLALTNRDAAAALVSAAAFLQGGAVLES